MTDKTKKPVKKTEEQLTIERLTAKIDKMEARDQKLKLEEQEERVAARQTIEAIRDDKNKLVVESNKKWPAMYEIKLENGGPIPPNLRGNFTSIAVADKAILAHTG